MGSRHAQSGQRVETTHHRERREQVSKKELSFVEHVPGWTTTRAAPTAQPLPLAGLTIPSSENQNSERLTISLVATEIVRTWFNFQDSVISCVQP